MHFVRRSVLRPLTPVCGFHRVLDGSASFCFPSKPVFIAAGISVPTSARLERICSARFLVPAMGANPYRAVRICKFVSHGMADLARNPYCGRRDLIAVDHGYLLWRS